MRIAAFTTIGGLLIYALLFLGQLWFDLFAPALFIKISITFGVVVFVVSASALIASEYFKEKQQKKDGYID